LMVGPFSTDLWMYIYREGPLSDDIHSL
jgi:hypothetical protein